MRWTVGQIPPPLSESLKWVILCAIIFSGDSGRLAVIIKPPPYQNKLPDHHGLAFCYTSHSNCPCFRSRIVSREA
jgi:hypothetical protein